MSSVKIIAEIGNTHEGSLGLAKRFVDAAAECGVDCVKFQTHIFDAESLPDAPNPPYFKDEKRKEYFDRTAFNLEQWKELKRYCEEECGVEFLSSPFSLEAIDLLEKVGVSSYKVPSGEVNNTPLLICLAETGKKVLLSSGMSSWDEIDKAIKTLQDYGCKDLVVLQCVSKYPCPPEEAGLNVIREMQDRYNIEVGYSDHTLGVAIPIAAVMMGATVIEKHFTLSKRMYGSDAKNSTEPDEFRYLVNQIRTIEKSLHNKVNKDEMMKDLEQMKTTFEKSIVSARPIEASEVIDQSMLAYKKPGDGIPARMYKKVLGSKLIKGVPSDHKFNWSDFE